MSKLSPRKKSTKNPAWAYFSYGSGDRFSLTEKGRRNYMTEQALDSLEKSRPLKKEPDTQ